DLRQDLIARIAVGADADFRLGLVAGMRGKTRLQFIERHRRLVPEQPPVLVDGQVYGFGLLVDLLGAGLRQIDAYGMRQQRRGDDEDYQQHQHDVDQRHHVDLGHRMPAAALAVEAAEGHHASPLEACPPRRSARTLPSECSTCWPVVRKANKSCAKASSRESSTRLLRTKAL